MCNAIVHSCVYAVEWNVHSVILCPVSVGDCTALHCPCCSRVLRARDACKSCVYKRVSATSYGGGMSTTR